MNRVFVRRASLTVVAGLVLAIAGCGGSNSEQNPSSAGSGIAETDQRTSNRANVGKRSFKPLELDNGPAGNEEPKFEMTAEQRAQTVLDKLQPLQVVLGKWRGTTFKKVGQFNSVEDVRWIWDFQTDEMQPTLVMATKSSPYLQQGRLTYLVDEEQYQFTAVDKEGNELTYVGEFSASPQDSFDGDNKTVQRSFKLEFKSASPANPQSKLVKLVFNQQQNDRYLLELYDKRDLRYDTIANQREGTSFAVSEDYGEKECIISQGLGTISISYKDKTYWVCCTGCEKAFNDDPEKWIAKSKKMK